MKSKYVLVAAGAAVLILMISGCGTTIKASPATSGSPAGASPIASPTATSVQAQVEAYFVIMKKLAKSPRVKHLAAHTKQAIKALANISATPSSNWQTLARKSHGLAAEWDHLSVEMAAMTVPPPLRSAHRQAVRYQRSTFSLMDTMDGLLSARIPLTDARWKQLQRIADRAHVAFRAWAFQTQVQGKKFHVKHPVKFTY